MTISTTNLADDTQSPLLARVELLAAIVFLNDLITTANAAKAGAMIPFDSTLSYTAGSLALTLKTAAQKGVVNVFTKGQSVTPVALTDGSTVAVDASTSNNFTLALTATGHTIGNPSNLQDGQQINIRVTNGGAYTLAYGSKWKWPSGTAPTLTSGSGKVDLICGIYYSGTDVILAAIHQDLH